MYEPVRGRVNGWADMGGQIVGEDEYGARCVHEWVGGEGVWVSAGWLTDCACE